NVIARGDNLAWFDGPTVIEALEEADSGLGVSRSGDRSYGDELEGRSRLQTAMGSNPAEGSRSGDRSYGDELEGRSGLQTAMGSDPAEGSRSGDRSYGDELEGRSGLQTAMGSD